MDKKILIYADGSSLGNPGPGGWGVVISSGEKILEIGGGNKHTTNNRMELTAVIEALKKVFFYQPSIKNYQLIIRTDSRYVINGITKWVYGWEKTGWIGKNKKSILNKDLWKKLVKITDGKNILWEHVHGHVGIAGNERADFIATLCAREKKIKTQKFFDGSLSKYPFDVFNSKESKKRPVLKNKSFGKTAYSYLSLVGGILMKHATWLECEKRVKGVSGAKFKKSSSKEDEENIIREWGVKHQ
ncbi:MAG: viroplasmin family protein [Patescibacteria group bacterium]